MAETLSVVSHRDGGVTTRVVTLCLCLAALFGYIIPIIDVKLSNTFLGAAHLPPGAVGVLLILLLVINPVLKTLGKRFAFSRNEILTIYITCLFSALVPGHGGENFFVTNIIGPFYYANPENKWLEFLLPNIQHWFTPAMTEAAQFDPEVVAGWYVGTQGQVPWAAWMLPLAAWSSVIIASYIMLACFSVMLRAQWAEREALSFPLLRLPLELTADVDNSSIIGKFFQDRLMWTGFGIVILIQLFNGLNLYFPDVPPIPLSLDGNYFSEAPWNQTGGARFVVLPIVVGITYLLTAEVSFSLWFFYWFIKFQLIAAYYLGFMPASLPNSIGSTAGGKTFVVYQQVGAYLMFAFLVLWTGREHLKHIVKRALGRAPAAEGEEREPISYPVAFWGFVLSFVFIIFWSWMSGMSVGVALALWIAYLVIAICLTRVVVEGGLLFVQQGWVPLGTMAQLTNSGPGTWLTPASVVPGTFLQASLMTDMRAFLMPSFVQSFKLAHDRGLRAKPLLALIAVVTLITFIMSIWMNVRLGYQEGGLQLNGWFAVSGAQQPAYNAQSLLNGVRDATWLNGSWMMIGGLLTWGMLFARSRLVWFPLHPLGLLMCLTYPMGSIWFSIFIGWMCKTLITKYGGSDSYQKTTPLFLGLALGDVVMMLFWLVIDGWFGRTGHQLMPG